jgi:hypothetical protein
LATLVLLVFVRGLLFDMRFTPFGRMTGNFRRFYAIRQQKGKAK